MRAYFAWRPTVGRRADDFDGYVQDVAQARYVIRRVLRIVDEQARQAGLEPLQHQALLQVVGARPGPLRVTELAERLDVTTTLASRLLRQLAVRELATRESSDEDRRVSLARPTAEGRDLIRRIDEGVHVQVAYLQTTLSPEERAAALGVLAFYVGATLTATADDALMVELPREEPTRTPVVDADPQATPPTSSSPARPGAAS